MSCMQTPLLVNRDQPSLSNVRWSDHPVRSFAPSTSRTPRWPAAWPWAPLPTSSSARLVHPSIAEGPRHPLQPSSRAQCRAKEAVISSQLLLNHTQLCPTCQPPAPSCSSTNIIIMMLHALRFSDPITFCLHARLATLRSHAYRQIACHRGEPPCLLPSVHSGSGTEPTTPRPRRRHRHRRGCRRALHLRFRPGVTSTAFSTLSLS
jgi:hypothetical protein